MVPDTPPSTAEVSTRGESSSTGINALIGAVAGVVLSFIPFSPVLGGAIAGYLEEGTTTDGAKVGAFAGLIMLIPFVFVGTVVMMWMLGLGGAPGGFIVMALLVVMFGAVYTVALSALGGYLGVYIKYEL